MRVTQVVNGAKGIHVMLDKRHLQRREVRDLDRPSARRRVERAGRDGRMGSAGAEQKDAAKDKKEQLKEDAVTSDAVA